jgi:hypothetical protein
MNNVILNKINSSNDTQPEGLRKTKLTDDTNQNNLTVQESHSHTTRSKSDFPNVFAFMNEKINVRMKCNKELIKIFVDLFGNPVDIQQKENTFLNLIRDQVNSIAIKSIYQHKTIDVLLYRSRKTYTEDFTHIIGNDKRLESDEKPFSKEIDKKSDKSDNTTSKISESGSEAKTFSDFKNINTHTFKGLIKNTTLLKANSKATIPFETERADTDLVDFEDYFETIRSKPRNCHSGNIKGIGPTFDFKTKIDILYRITSRQLQKGFNILKPRCLTHSNYTNKHDIALIIEYNKSILDIQNAFEKYFYINEFLALFKKEVSKTDARRRDELYNNMMSDLGIDLRTDDILFIIICKGSEEDYIKQDEDLNLFKKNYKQECRKDFFNLFNFISKSDAPDTIPLYIAYIDKMSLLRAEVSDNISDQIWRRELRFQKKLENLKDYIDEIIKKRNFDEEKTKKFLEMAKNKLRETCNSSEDEDIK